MAAVVQFLQETGTQPSVHVQFEPDGACRLSDRPVEELARLDNTAQANGLRRAAACAATAAGATLARPFKRVLLKRADKLSNATIADARRHGKLHLSCADLVLFHKLVSQQDASEADAHMLALPHADRPSEGERLQQQRAAQMAGNARMITALSSAMATMQIAQLAECGLDPPGYIGPKERPVSEEEFRLTLQRMMQEPLQSQAGRRVLDALRLDEKGSFCAVALSHVGDLLDLDVCDDVKAVTIWSPVVALVLNIHPAQLSRLLVTRQQVDRLYAEAHVALGDMASTVDRMLHPRGSPRQDMMRTDDPYVRASACLALAREFVQTSVGRRIADGYASSLGILHRNAVRLEALAELIAEAELSDPNLEVDREACIAQLDRWIPDETVEVPRIEFFREQEHRTAPPLPAEQVASLAPSTPVPVQAQATGAIRQVEPQTVARSDRAASLRGDVIAGVVRQGSQESPADGVANHGSTVQRAAVSVAPTGRLKYPKEHVHSFAHLPKREQKSRRRTYAEQAKRTIGKFESLSKAFDDMVQAKKEERRRLSRAALTPQGFARPHDLDWKGNR